MEEDITRLSGIQKLEEIVYNGEKLNSGQKDRFRQFIDTIWDEHSDVGNRFPRWKKYIAWVAGYQLYDYNRFSQKLIELPVKRKNRIVFNRLRSFIRTMLAKLSSDIPQMGVVPRTSENSDKESARAGDRLMEHLADKIDLPAILTDLKLWAIVCNRAFLRVFWDIECGAVDGVVLRITMGNDCVDPVIPSALKDEYQFCVIVKWAGPQATRQDLWLPQVQTQGCQAAGLQKVASCH